MVRFLRGLVMAIAFVVFPVALVVVVDLTIYNAKLDELWNHIVVATLESPTARGELVDSLAKSWLEASPEVSEALLAQGRDPETTLVEAVDEMSNSEAFRSEVADSSWLVLEHWVRGDSEPVPIDISDMVRASGVELSREVQSAIDQNPNVEFVLPAEAIEAQNAMAALVRVRLFALLATISSALVLAALTRSLRFIPASTGLIGLPIYWLHWGLLNAAGGQPAEVGDQIVAEAARAVLGPPVLALMLVCAAMLVFWLGLAAWKLRQRRLKPYEAQRSAEADGNFPSYLGDQDDRELVLSASGSPIISEPWFG